VTLAQSLYKIARVAHCLAPGRDWRWLRRVVRRLDLRAKPRDKRNDVVPIKQLFHLGLQLMDRAENAAEATTVFRARQYRDGLILPFSRLTRSASPISQLWKLAEPSSSMARPGASISRLRRPRQVACTSPSCRTGVRLVSIYGLICKRTRDVFCKRINPHLFRSCLATSTAIYHGAEIGLAMTVLDHTSSEVFERYYNQAKMIDAVKGYQEIPACHPARLRRKE
jgi:integrase/recombinase XerD